MIKLSTNSTTTESKSFGGVTTTTTTDTLYISNVVFDFQTSSIRATVMRGTTLADGSFVPNYPSVEITVKSDTGSFVSSDNVWAGSLGSAAATLVSTLKSQLDQFILGSGLVSGTAV